MDIQASSNALNSVSIGSGNSGALESVAKTQSAPDDIAQKDVKVQQADVDGGKVVDISA